MSRYTTLSTNEVTVTTSSTEIIAADSRRDFLHLQNNSTNTILIRFGTAAAINDETSIKLVSGAEMTFHTPGVGAIQAIALTATSGLTVTTNDNSA